MKKLVVSPLWTRQRSLRNSLSVYISRSAVPEVDGKICKLASLELVCLTERVCCSAAAEEIDFSRSRLETRVPTEEEVWYVETRYISLFRKSKEREFRKLCRRFSGQRGKEEILAVKNLARAEAAVV